MAFINYHFNGDGRETVVRTQGFPILKETARIKKMPSSCWIVDIVSDDGRRILPREAFFLSLCSGEFDLSTLQNISAQVFDKDEDTIGSELCDVLTKWDRYVDWFDQPSQRSYSYPPEQYLYHPKRTVLAAQGRLDSPGEATLILTHACNFKCVYCFNSSSIERVDDLSTQEWLDIIEQAKAQSIVKCTISGGEPLMHPGFFEILDRLMEYGISAYVCTNGSLVTPEIAHRLRTMGLPCIQVSLDAACAATHDKIAAVPPGTFPKVIEAIRTLIAMGIVVYVKAVMTPVNVGEAGELIDLCHGLGVKRLILDRFDLSNAGRGNANLFIDRQQELALAELVTRKQAELGAEMSISAITMSRCWSGQGDIVYCGALSTSVTILPNGDISVCEKLIGVPEMTAGNIRRNSIEDIWTAPRTQAILRPSVDQVAEPCKSCDLLASCNTGCYAQTLFVSDNPYAPDPRCWRADFANNPYRTHYLVENPHQAERVAS